MPDLRYRCLILDHDDTAVDSTSSVHYPAHVEVMRQLRPDRRPVDLEGWFRKNFNPGIVSYLKNELGLSEREFGQEYAIWRSFTSSRTPAFYPGMPEILTEFHRRGGRIAVVSHSEPDIILRHYREAGNGCPLPDLVFGWDAEEERRKPSPWPVLETLRRLNVQPAQALVLDDLKPGVIMARRAGVAAAGAGWAHRIPEIREYMRASCLAFFETVAEFSSFLLLPTSCPRRSPA
jgi:phosphoglycolate phosphatase/pyrophosphatase PpaX